MSPIPGSRPILPSFSLEDQGQRCLDASRGLEPSPQQTEQLQNVQTHSPASTYHYYQYLNFITTNNIYHPTVLAAFLQLVDRIRSRLASDGPSTAFRDHEIEIVIIVRCVSSTNPKCSYYVVDHTEQTIRWFHGVPRFSDVHDPRMRNAAEYWYHRSQFPAHKYCTQDDLNQTIRLLDDMVQNVAGLSQSDIETYRRNLNDAQSQRELSGNQTIAIAKTHNELLKRSLPHFYRSNIKCKIIKSLSGISISRFTHNCTPITSDKSAAQIIRDHENQPSVDQAAASRSNTTSSTSST